MTTEALNALAERAVVALERIAGVLAGQTAPKVSDETLVPEERSVELALVPVGHCHAAVIGTTPETWDKGFAVCGALALCAASLRARAAQQEEG